MCKMYKLDSLRDCALPPRHIKLNMSQADPVSQRPFHKDLCLPSFFPARWMSHHGVPGPTLQDSAPVQPLLFAALHLMPQVH
jgi:hypothetical protein